MTMDRPFVLINTAVTADGKIDTSAREGAPISSAGDFARVDRLRAASDAVMVGGHTLLREDPSLNVKTSALRQERRERGLEENPIKVGVVSRIGNPDEGLCIKSDGKFLNAGSARVVVFTSEQTEAKEIERLRDKGAQVFVVGERRVNLAEALHRLVELGVERLMVEGGGTLNAELLRLGLVDEVHLYIAPLIFGGATSPTLADGEGLTRSEAVQLRLLGVEQFEDGGIVVQYGVGNGRS